MSQQQSTERNAASAAGERKRLLSYTELRELKGIPFSMFWILQLVRAGKFPRPIKINRGGFNCWFEDEIDTFLEGLRARRDEEQED